MTVLKALFLRAFVFQARCWPAARSPGCFPHQKSRGRAVCWALCSAFGLSWGLSKPVACVSGEVSSGEIRKTRMSLFGALDSWPA